MSEDVSALFEQLRALARERDELRSLMADWLRVWNLTEKCGPGLPQSVDFRFRPFAESFRRATQK